jgi:hypothetical protein
MYYIKKCSLTVQLTSNNNRATFFTESEIHLNQAKNYEYKCVGIFPGDFPIVLCIFLSYRFSRRPELKFTVSCMQNTLYKALTRYAPFL